MDWQKLISDVGAVAGIAIFFVWTSWKREQALGDRIGALEKFVEQELIDLVRSTADALRRNTEQMADLIKVLGNRPCLYEEEKRKA